MAQKTPLISIIVLVKNGASSLQRLLDAIYSQSLISDSEVIIIDSGSTDEGLTIVKNYPVRLISIPPNSFNHGDTRNLGVQQASGKFIVMTVQDAEPESERWLNLLLDGFIDDSVAGVCGQQIVPHDPDKNPIAWFRPVNVPQMKKFFYGSSEQFHALSPQIKREVCRWDDVNAAYRRDILLKVPFQKVLFAEDALWASDVLAAGYSIVYYPQARVKHYHLETPDYTFRRIFTESYHFYKFFGLKPQFVANGLKQVLQNIKVLIQATTITPGKKIEWLLFNYRQRKAINLAVALFYKMLAKGLQQLDQKHFELCGRAPQINDTKNG
jgi:rhamnosyltransferase